MGKKAKWYHDTSLVDYWMHEHACLVSQKTWRVYSKTVLNNGRRNWLLLGEVCIKRGILQGDSLSPLLFVLALMPLTLVLRKVKAGYNLENGLPTINHLLFMDDLKLYGKKQKPGWYIATVCPSSQWRHQNGIWNRKMRRPGHEEEETGQVRGYCNPGWKADSSNECMMVMRQGHPTRI